LVKNITIREEVYKKLLEVKEKKASANPSKETTDIASTQNITIYDFLYIAATRKLKATLYTADPKLYNMSKKIISSKLLKP